MSTLKPLMDVLQGQTPGRRPVWMMRQAGRYLPEYRSVRERAGSFLQLCYSPELAAEVTIQPLRRFDLDAAIIFSDILVVPQAMGLKLEFVDLEGPKLSTVADDADVGALNSSGRFTEFELVCETIRRVKGELGRGTALIGFCGGPWTVASYMIEGGSSNRARAKAVALRGEQWFVSLVAKLVDVSVEYLSMQIAAGVEVVQIFDSWAGDLPIEQQRQWVDRPIAEIVRRLRITFPSVPVIVFARGVGLRHVEVQGTTHCNAVSIEQGVSCADILSGLPVGTAVQGNLDPQLLLGDQLDLVGKVKEIAASVPLHRHIFNLGHGIFPQTEPDTVGLVIETIRKHDAGVAA